jgi:general secretion pathway protein K
MVRNSSGMALVLTLLAVSFLVAVTVQLSGSVNWQMQAAANQGRIVRLDAMLASGLSLVRAALRADQQENEYDTVFDSWAVIGPETLQALFPEGRLELKVTDLSGLLQINALVKKSGTQAGRSPKPVPGQGGNKDFAQLQRAIWQRLLLSGNFAVEDEDTARELLDTLSDWLDPDENERENGAEQGYYASLDPPYAPANGPMLFREELLLVKGWTRQLLYGDKEHSGILQYLTAGGDGGKININTAPAPVLMALSPEMTEELAADLIDFRNDEANRDRLAAPDWYRSVDGFPGDVTLEQKVITTGSNVFMVTVNAAMDRLQRTGTGILLRLENGEQKLLYWKVE